MGGTGERIGRATEFLGDVEEALGREFTQLISGLRVEQDPEVGADEGEARLVARRTDQEGGGELDGCHIGDFLALPEEGAVDQGLALAGGFDGDLLPHFYQ